MNYKILLVAAGVLALGCNEKKTDGTEAKGSTAAAAVEPSCDAVVAKMLSFQPGSGEPEKKLLTKMCPGMPVAMKSCVVGAKTKEDYDKCSKLGAGKPIQ